jgi:hypothetical protein
MALSIKEKLNTAADELLKLIPADQQEAARAHYSRLQDATRDVESVSTRQQAWWETNKDAVNERDTLRAQLAARPAAPEDGMNRNQIQAALDQQKQELLETGLSITTLAATLAVNHYNEFKEPLDMTDLTKKAIAANKPLDTFYAESVAQRRAERQTAERAEEIKKAREEGRTEGLTEGLKRVPGGALPYPVGQNAPTTLAGITKSKPGETPAVNPEFTLDAAVATANAVMAGQNR